ncbi:aspartate 1-decarboxylase [Micromonospora sp. NPDC049662]|uniref:aspartate 1-decarboxylase n=1 Tax=Micromonospora sp. NPDC049662 TaxID=3155397 RepID=UPI00343CBB33
MILSRLTAQVQRATVTEANLHYVGSLTLDEDLMRAGGLLPGEQVAVIDVTNGARLETYLISGVGGSGVVGINGAAAHFVHPGDLVTIIGYSLMDMDAARSFQPRVVHVDHRNRVVELSGDPAGVATGMAGELHGQDLAVAGRAKRRSMTPSPVAEG